MFDEDKGYIPYLQQLCYSDSEKFVTLIQNEIKAGFVAGSEDNANARKSRALMNLLLSSPDLEFVEAVKEESIEALLELPQKSKDYQLILSVGSGQTAMLDFLIDIGADLNARDPRDGNSHVTALHWAIFTSDTKTVKFLLSRMSEEAIDAQDDLKQTALHRAIGMNNSDIAELLFSKMSQKAIDAKDIKGQTPLYCAIRMDNLEMAESLLPKMSQEAINAQENNGLTALHIAVGVGNSKMVRLLLSKMSQDAIDVPERKTELTALHIAVMADNLEMVKLLLPKMSQDVIAGKGDEGATVLDIAVRAGNLEMVKLLLPKISQGAIAEKGDNGTMTVLHYAVMAGNLEMVKLLLPKMSQDVIAGKGEGATVLHCAVMAGNLEMVKLLLPKMSQDVIARKNNGTITVLQIAVRADNLEMVKMLLPEMSQNAIDAQSGYKHTALHYAVMAGNLEMVEMLLPKMSKEAICKKDANEKSVYLSDSKRINNLIRAAMDPDKALQEAITQSNGEDVEFVIKCGAKVNHKVSTHQETMLYKAIVAAQPETKESIKIIKILLEAGAKLETPYFSTRISGYSSVDVVPKSCPKILRLLKVEQAKQQKLQATTDSIVKSYKRRPPKTNREQKQFASKAGKKLSKHKAYEELPSKKRGDIKRNIIERARTEMKSENTGFLRRILPQKLR